ncbi:MAG: zinc ribbon domain-containing protein [Deltaproteobacteria bacterium]|nr:zinc ribbon domain-containing protein [Deltaproteobacteria bacterium]
MPIYEYKCESCDSCFEKLVFSSDEKEIVCPCCGGVKTKKLLSAGTFVSGSGSGSACAPNASSGFS